MRKSLLFLSVLMCFSVLTGCGASEAEQAAMDKMSADYSDTFSYEKREGDGFLVKSDALDADVYVEQADDGEYHDNYLAVKYEDETKSYIEDCVAQFYDNAIVHFEAPQTGLTGGLSADADFASYMADSGAILTGVIELRDSDYLTQFDVSRMAGAMAMYGTSFDFDFVVLSDDVFDTLSVDEIRERIESGDVVAHADLIKQGDSVQINWVSE